MARFERSSGKSDRRDSRRRPRREHKSFEEYSQDRRGSRRDSNRRSAPRRDSGRKEVEMTKVTCSACGVRCEVPFKPTSSKPIYCDACFAKKDKQTSQEYSNKDLDIINEKLNKIMKALNIK